MIFIDPTEARERTRLPQSVIDQSQVLPGLEWATGADILVTVHKFKARDLTPLRDLNGEIFDQRSPGEIAKRHNIPIPVALLGLNFKKACEEGLLVQRKSGRDLSSSVPNLSSILVRMKKWTDRPWLLFVGNKYSKKGQCVIDGQDTGFTSAAVEGALAFWQLRGGFITEKSYDNEIMPWLAGWLDRLRALDGGKEIEPRVVQQPLDNPNEKPWRATLLTVPGWGAVKVNALAELSTNLMHAIEWGTCPTWRTDKGATSRPKEIGWKDASRFAEWFGCENAYDQIVGAAVPPGTMHYHHYRDITDDTSEM